MADKRIFTIEIDGVRQSIADITKLWEALNGLKDAHVRVITEIQNATQANGSNTITVREQTTALNEQNEAEQQLLETMKEREQLETPLAKAQALANEDLKRRAQQLQQTAQLELAANGSIDQHRLQLEALTAKYKALGKEEREAENVGGALLEQIREKQEEYEKLEKNLTDYSASVHANKESINGLIGSLASLSEGIEYTSNGTRDFVSIFEAGAGVLQYFGYENKNLEKVLGGVSKIMATVNKVQEINEKILKKNLTTLKANTAATTQSAAAQKASTVATTAATTATGLFRKALMSTGVGALVVGLGLLISNFEDIKKWITQLVPEVSNLGKYFDELRAIAKGVGDAVVNYILNPFKTAVIVISKIIEGDFEGAMKATVEGVKNTFNVIDNFEKGYEEEKERQRKEREQKEKERIKQQQADAIRELEREIELNKSKGDSDWEYSKEAQEAYEELYEKKKELYAEDKEEMHRLEVDRNNYLKNLRDHENSENEKRAQAGREAAKKRQDEYSELQKSLQSYDNETTKLVEENSKRKMEAEKEAAKSVEQLNEYYGKAEQVLKYKEQKSIEAATEEFKRLEKECQNQIDKGMATQQELENLRETHINRLVAMEVAFADKVDELNKEKDDRIKEAQLKALEERKTLMDIEISNMEEVYNRAAEVSKNYLAKNKNGIVDVELTRKNLDEAKQCLEEYMNNLYKQKGEVEKYYDDQLSLYDKDEVGYKKLQDEKQKALAGVDKDIKKASDMMDENAKQSKEVQQDAWKSKAEYIEKKVNEIMGYANKVFEGVNALLNSELEDAKEKLDSITEKYDEAVTKREESDSRIQELEEKAKNARGGRALILQQQINAEMEANKQLADQEASLAKEKEKQEKEVEKKEKQKRKSEVLQNITQGIAGTASAVIGALGNKPWTPANIALAAVVGAAGAVQVGVMAKQLAKLEDGGLLKGKRHSQGGMRVEGTNIEVEGGEYVVNRVSTEKNIGLIRYINSQRRPLGAGDLDSFFSKSARSFEPPFKRMFEAGGQLPAIENNVAIDNDALIDAIQSIKIEPKVSVTDINDAQSEIVKVDNWTGL